MDFGIFLTHIQNRKTISKEEMNAFRFLFLLALVSLLTSSCKNKTDKAIDWLSTIPINYSKEEIEKSQPEFVKIDWNKIVEEGDEGYYRYNTDIFESKGVFKIQYQLRFKDDRFAAIVGKVNLAVK
jgi:hypothetical protein